MHQHHHDSEGPGKLTAFLKSGGGVALVMLVLVGVFYLIREHWTHLGQTWPYLLLLLCPLMHVFMHGGHGGHGHGGHGGHRHGGPTVRANPAARDNEDNAA